MPNLNYNTDWVYHLNSKIFLSTFATWTANRGIHKGAMEDSERQIRNKTTLPDTPLRKTIVYTNEISDLNPVEICGSSKYLDLSAKS